MPLAADVAPFYAELLKSAADGLRCAAGAEHEGSFVVGLQQRTYALDKAYDVGVEAFEVWFCGAGLLSLNSYDVDGSYGACFVGKLVEERNDGLLVGNGDVEASEPGMLGKQLR